MELYGVEMIIVHHQHALMQQSISVFFVFCLTNQRFGGRGEPSTNLSILWTSHAWEKNFGIFKTTVRHKCGINQKQSPFYAHSQYCGYFFLSICDNRSQSDVSASLH